MLVSLAHRPLSLTPRVRATLRTAARLVSAGSPPCTLDGDRLGTAFSSDGVQSWSLAFRQQIFEKVRFQPIVEQNGPKYPAASAEPAAGTFLRSGRF
jgi:hypothetical protein